MSFYGEVTAVEQYQGQLLIQWHFKSTHLVNGALVDGLNRFAMPVPTGTRQEIRDAVRSRLESEIRPQVDDANRALDSLPTIVGNLVGFRYPAS